MPADYNRDHLEQLAAEGSPDEPGSVSRCAVQINRAFAELALMADQQPDKWLVLATLHRAAETLRPATADGPAQQAQRHAGDRTHAIVGKPHRSCTATSTAAMTRRSDDRLAYTTPPRWVAAKPCRPPGREVKQTMGAAVPDLQERLSNKDESNDVVALGDLDTDA
jgi:hypothetical protein